MNWENIWALQPMDGQAASVVSQAGCKDEMSLEDKNGCLLSAILSRQSQLVNMSEGNPKRKQLGMELKEIELMKGDINRKIKFVNMNRLESQEDFIIQECKKILTTEQWKEIVKTAKLANKKQEQKALSESY